MKLKSSLNTSDLIEVPFCREDVSWKTDGFYWKDRKIIEVSSVIWPHFGEERGYIHLDEGHVLTYTDRDLLQEMRLGPVFINFVEYQYLFDFVAEHIQLPFGAKTDNERMAEDQYHTMCYMGELRRATMMIQHGFTPAGDPISRTPTKK